ncbi:MAG TPA: hypothetical protein VLC93_17510, partial [Myxococcota bacterium]|nr:hypothetical protein [Myxococcota bacterium]
GSQAPSAVVSWRWVVAPEGFDTTVPPPGPVLGFSPDVVGSYALEATATHRGGSTANMLILQVRAASTVALMNPGGGDSIVEFFTDGSAQVLLPDFFDVQAHAGLQLLPGHNAIFAGAVSSLTAPDLTLAADSPSGLESEGDAVSCAGAFKVWAIADDGTGGCCPAGSSGTLATFSLASYGCCKQGFEYFPSGSCEVRRERPATAFIATTANTGQGFGGVPALAGPAGHCDWTDLPPATIDPDNVDVKLCRYEIRALSSARDGSNVAFVLSRQFVPDPSHLPGRAGLAVIVDAPSHLNSVGVEAGLPDASVVLLSTEVEVADLQYPPLSYLRLAHDPSGTRLAVLAGPMDVLASAGSLIQPSAIADYGVTIYDPVSHATVAASSDITMRASWRAVLLLLPNNRIVLSPDGLSVQVSTTDVTTPAMTALWATPARADYVPIDANYHAALACAPLCEDYSASPAPDLNACADACCTCLAESAMTDPAVRCHALSGTGDSGVSISVYDGVSRNAAGTLLSASKTTTLIPFDRCDDIFLFEKAPDLERVHELVTHVVATQSETHYAIAALTGGDPTHITRIPSTGFLADDSQLSFTLRLQANPAPPRFVEFWILNRDGSRPRQLLPDGASFFEQTNEPPENGCAQTPLGSLPFLVMFAGAMLLRGRRPLPAP